MKLRKKRRRVLLEHPKHFRVCVPGLEVPGVVSAKRGQEGKVADVNV